MSQPEQMEFFPLSNAQELIWLGQSIRPEVPLYNMAWRFDLRMDLDVQAFEQAFRALVDSSDSMRLRFEKHDGEAIQTVADADPIDLPLIDLTAEVDPEGQLTAWLDQRIRHPLDLRNSAYEAALVKLHERHWVWFINLHHLITDGSASFLLYDRLANLYVQAGQGELTTEPSYPGYTDHVQREQDRRDSGELAPLQEHWSQHGSADAAPLTLYGRRNEHRDTANIRVPVSLGNTRSERLNALANREGFRSLSPHLTRFNLFATALFAWLHRVSGQSVLTIGTPAHNRMSPSDRQTLGLFIEVFPMHIEVRDGDTFRSLFQRVAAEANQLLRHSQPGVSDAGLAQRFNLVLNYIHGAFGEFDGQAAQAQWLHPGHVDAAHDLRIQVHDFAASGEYHLDFDCSTVVFDAELREAAPRHFMMLLDAMLDDPAQLIEQVSLVSDNERQHCIRDFNSSYTEQQPQSVVARFLAQADSSPDAIAVQQDGIRLSYAQLAQDARHLSQALRKRGITTALPVGIHMSRSADFVVAVLGVLGAGAAFVPLEASMPVERLRTIIADAGLQLLLIDPGRDLPGVSCASPRELLEEQGEPAPPLQQPTDDQMAYAIYTSGSTGRPKGVVVEHAALASYADWAYRTFSGGQPGSYPLYSSISFDLTITSLFVPLISGGRIVVYREHGTGTDLAVLQVFADDQVDVVKLTPAHLALVLEQPRPPSRIRTLILGGENLNTELARRAHSALGHISIFNEYGPTEGVVGCMVHAFDADKDTEDVVPIGRPAGHQRIYVLDPGGNPVPHGISGELFIAGRHLARGYLGQETLTDERFLPDPFYPAERMYRSGDLARFDHQGILYCLGRIDSQFKLAGVRIEPAEIQQALLAHPGITEAVVEMVQSQRKAPPREAPRDAAVTARHCVQCGLSSDYPGISFNQDGVCHLCSEFETYRDKAEVYFGGMIELHGLVDDARRRAQGRYDCICLLSGGKDSTYALYRMAELGPRILAITLDNGYISEGAKQNIRRVVESLGIDHRFVTTPHMNAIFSDSLERHSNVCHGCFKTIYTLAIGIALNEDIPYIVTGLSRGQFFETRLTPDLFDNGALDRATIEDTVLQARKAYHHIDDAVSRLMDVRMFDDPHIFDKVRFIDFYRYCDVGLDEVYRFLDQHAPWTRPRDTGRSTNCLINDVGIHVHKRKEGFHNYALPYSWDVRMGHKSRDAALEELNDDIDPGKVQQILGEIGYPLDDMASGAPAKRLVAYYVAEQPVDDAALRTHLRQYLVDAMLPAYLVPLEHIPLTGNGKIDRSALPRPTLGRPQPTSVYRAPQTPVQHRLADIWMTVLDIDRVGLNDNYYALGGDSISAIQIATRARHLGIGLAATDIFEHQTIEALAAELDGRGSEASDDSPVAEDRAPAQFSMADLDDDKLARLEQLLGKAGDP